MKRLSHERLEEVRILDKSKGDDLRLWSQTAQDVRDLLGHVDALVNEADPAAVPMLLWCPGCGQRHLDEGEYATQLHHTHACQHCGMVWRPALVHTVGVRFLPGFLNLPPEPTGEPE